MLIDTVDHSDNVTGTIEKGDALLAGVNFRVAHVFVFNEDGLLLIQQIPETKRHPGKWGSSVAGYVYAGETYAEAATRRLSDELGIHIPLHFKLKAQMQEGIARKFISLFVTSWDGEIKPAAVEVADVEWIDMRLVTHLQETGARQFTPTFLHLVHAFTSSRR